MTSTATEFDVEFDEDSDDESPDYEDIEFDDEEDEDNVSPVARRQDSVAQLEAELVAAQKEIADYKQRLGDAIRVGGERLKAKDKEIEEWLEKIPSWHESEVEDAKREAFEEGVRSVEERLLPLLHTEEKTEYLLDQRTRPAVKVSPRKDTPQLDFTRKASSSDATEDVHALVRQFTALGVPLDQIEQTSAEAVVKSGGKYLADQRSAAEEQARNRSESQEREDSGATRVSSGTGASPRPTASADQRRLNEVNTQLKALRGRGLSPTASKLLAEKKTLEARLNAARARRNS